MGSRERVLRICLPKDLLSSMHLGGGDIILDVALAFLESRYPEGLMLQFVGCGRHESVCRSTTRDPHRLMDTICAAGFFFLFFFFFFFSPSLRVGGRHEVKTPDGTRSRLPLVIGIETSRCSETCSSETAEKSGKGRSDRKIYGCDRSEINPSPSGPETRERDTAPEFHPCPFCCEKGMCLDLLSIMTTHGVISCRPRTCWSGYLPLTYSIQPFSSLPPGQCI